MHNPNPLTIHVSLYKISPPQVCPVTNTEMDPYFIFIQVPQYLINLFQLTFKAL